MGGSRINSVGRSDVQRGPRHKNLHAPRSQDSTVIPGYTRACTVGPAETKNMQRYFGSALYHTPARSLAKNSGVTS